MKRIVLLRHGGSLWNRENRFTGWTDVDLNEKGVGEACKAGDALREAGFFLEAVYISCLKHAVKTLNCVLGRLDKDWILVEKIWRLNEEYYGMSQGLNKSETAVQYDEEQVHIWRRSYDAAPIPVGKDDPRNPGMDICYAGVPDSELPRTESPRNTIERAMSYWKCIIFPVLMHKDSLLVIAHDNSLRGTIKHLKGISDMGISNLSLSTVVPYVFELDDRPVLVKDYYLGNPEEIRKRAEAVAKQGMAKK